jgi:hypothetical protein
LQTDVSVYRVMKSIQNARLVLVVGEDSAVPLFSALRRMEPQSLTLAKSLGEARSLCDTGAVDACLVILPAAEPDACPGLVAEADADAPGVCAGVPSLLFADFVTPHVARFARRQGYAAALPVRLAPRLVYRRIAAVLQRSGRHAPIGPEPSGSTERAAHVGTAEALGFATLDAGKFKLQ